MNRMRPSITSYLLDTLLKTNQYPVQDDKWNYQDSLILLATRDFMIRGQRKLEFLYSFSKGHRFKPHSEQV